MLRGILFALVCFFVHLCAYELSYKIPGPRRFKDKIGIVGAGPAGVHMAYLLKQKGFKNVEILEKSSRIGGKSQSISYRGAIQELGTVYISPDYEGIHELVKKFVPNDMIPFPSASIWMDHSPKPITFDKFVVGYITKEIFNGKSQNIAIIMGTLLKAIGKYEVLHRSILGEYKGEIMPEPSPENMSKLKGTFMKFIVRNNLKALVPIFFASMTLQGYGFLDEISALYGLMWNTPKFINGFKERLQGKGNGGMTKLKSGFQNLWETIVKQENLNVTFGVDIYKVFRPIITLLKDGRNGQSNTCPSVWVCKTVRGKYTTFPRWERYDFLIWSPEMKSSLHLWKGQTEVENKLFSSTTAVYFATSILDSHNMIRGRTPIDYWIDNVMKKRDGSVWAQRDSYGVTNNQKGKDYEFGKLRSSNDNNNMKTTITYQMSRREIPDSVLKKQLLDHFEKINATNLFLQKFKNWRYFPRYTPAEMTENGILWRILEKQGRFDMWYIGSSVCFESVKSVVEYNKLLIENMKSP